jgi:hypothetical protein
LEELKMKEPQIVLEWKASAKSDALVRVLQRRFPPVPRDLEERIRSCTDADQLDRWIDTAAPATSLEEFRREAGL